MQKCRENKFVFREVTKNEAEEGGLKKQEEEERVAGVLEKELWVSDFSSILANSN